MASWECLDGNEAVALVAHRLSDVCAIYPITPASAMGEFADAWSAAGRDEPVGHPCPRSSRCSPRAGAAGALHGALQKGALATTFTASQGLLLMLPNMYKIAGELTPAVIHVAARALATHALSIFGDHSDVMAARGTGWAHAVRVQRAGGARLRPRLPRGDAAHPRALPALLRRVPHVARGRQDRAARRRRPARAGPRTPTSLDHRARGLSPGAARAARHRAEPRRVLPGPRGGQPVLRRRARGGAGGVRRAGRAHRPALRPRRLPRGARRRARRRADGLRRRRRRGGRRRADGAGEKVGVLTVRLYRPFPVDALLAALPATGHAIAVLDRVKEPGAPAEPLHLDVVLALQEAGRPGAR